MTTLPHVPHQVRVPGQRRPADVPLGGPGSAPGERLRATPPRLPWTSVLGLGVPLALASTFWTVALRTSVGSIERTGDPSGSWARESLLALPWYAAAVMAALLLLRRWYGAKADRPRPLLLGLLVVAGLATLVGLGQLTVSSLLDLRLQLDRPTAMPDMPGAAQVCADPCVSAARDAAVALQRRAVLVGTVVLMLPTNLVLVGWVLAARGGRLPLATSARPAAGPRPGGPTRLGPAEALVVSSLVGAAVVHLLVVPEHLAEWPLAAAFFVLLALAEVALGLRLARVGARSTAVLLWCVLLSAGPLLLWATSRTIGLPFGPDAGVPEAVGAPDLAACALEAAALLTSLRLLWRPPQLASGRHQDLARVLAVLVLGVAAAGAAGVDLTWV